MAISPDILGTSKAITEWEQEAEDFHQRALAEDPRPVRECVPQWPERDTPLFPKPIPGPRYI